jgi:hypothetical protein
MSGLGRTTALCINAAPTRIDKPLPLVEEETPSSKHMNGLGTNINFGSSYQGIAERCMKLTLCSTSWMREHSFVTKANGCVWNQRAYNKWDSCTDIFSLSLISTGRIRANSLRKCLLLISSVFTNKIIRSSVLYMMPNGISHHDSRPYYEINRNILGMALNSTRKRIFADLLHGMGSTFIPICPSRLVRTSLLKWSTPWFHKHETALLIQRVESITDVLFPDVSLIVMQRKQRSRFWIPLMI